MPNIEDLLARLEAALARLDRQANAIRDLRARVAALEGVSASSDTAGGGGGFTLPPTCPQCDGPREPGRKTLTCAACSVIRNTIIKSKGADRSEIMRDTCACCSATFPASVRLLCVKCSAAFKVWKASQ